MKWTFGQIDQSKIPVDDLPDGTIIYDWALDWERFGDLKAATTLDICGADQEEFVVFCHLLSCMTSNDTARSSFFVTDVAPSVSDTFRDEYMAISNYVKNYAVNIIPKISDESSDSFVISSMCVCDNKIYGGISMSYTLNPFSVQSLKICCPEFGSIDCDDPAVDANSQQVTEDDFELLNQIAQDCFDSAPAMTTDQMDIVIPEVHGSLANENQVYIAEHLVAKCVEMLGSMGDSFCIMNFKIFVPKFNTLRTQTMKRLHEVLPEVLDVSKHVVNFSVPGKKFSTIITNLKTDIMRKKNELFVLVLDECHYGPTCGTTSTDCLINDPLIMECKNVLVLFVSATPYNCLSKSSRIPTENWVRWSEVLSHNKCSPPYVGMDFYFSSLLFEVPPAQFTVTFEGTDYLCNFTPTHKYGSYFELASDVNALIVSSLPEKVSRKTKLIVFRQENSRFEISCGTVPPRISGLIIREDQSRLFRSLGFESTVSVGPASNLVLGKIEFDVDSSCPLTSQHIRADFSYKKLHKKIVEECPYLKTDGLLPVEFMPLFLCPNKPAPAVTVYGAPARVKQSFPMIVDYMMSLAYFAACGLDKTAEVTWAMVNKYIEILFHSSFCVTKSPKSVAELCNLSGLVNAALKYVVKMVRQSLMECEKEHWAQIVESCKDKDNESVLQDKHILMHFLRLKQVARQSQVTSESWYTETDRIVLMLLTGKSTVPLIMLRVHENDDNRAFQNILRHCLQLCLSHSDWLSADRNDFSIVGDTSTTVLTQSLEPHFRQMLDQDPKAAITFESFTVFPILLIVCEKGRMGDTFPSNLRVLDLRVRTGGTLSAFMQELGRMCRYVAYKSPPLSSFSRIDCDSPFAVTPELTQLLHKRTVAVHCGNYFIGVAETKAQLISLFIKASNESHVLQIDISELKDKLPFALIDSTIMTEVYEALKRCEEMPNNNRNEHPVSHFIRMNGSIDKYMPGKNTVHDHLTDKKPGVIVKEHFDFNSNNVKHAQRMLLWAECQIGKTGAYLDFLVQMKKIFTREPKFVEDEWLKWLVPNGVELTNEIRDESNASFRYDTPKSGKYHRKVANQRLDILCAAVLSCKNNFDAFSAIFRNLIVQYESASCEMANVKLNSLFGEWATPLAVENNTFIVRDGDEDRLFKYLNWDGRMDLAETCFGNTSFVRQCANQINHYGSLLYQLSPTIRTVGDSCYEGVQMKEDTMQQVNTVQSLTTEDMINDEEVVYYDDEDDDDMSHGELSEIVLPTYRAKTAKDLSCLSDSCQIFEYILRGNQQERGRLSIPFAALMLMPSVNMDTLTVDLRILKYVPRRITSWIFTPSFCGIGIDPSEKLLARDEMFILDGQPLERFVDYCEILVVRDVEFTSYMSVYGSTHLIVSLPPMLCDATYLQTEPHGGESEKAYTCSAGIGYARRFIQLFAHTVGLSAVWVTDDNILSCERYLPGGTEKRTASIAEVMQHIEFLVSDSNDVSSKSCGLEVANLKDLIDENRVDKSNRVGGSKLYGIIGTCRPRKYRHPNLRPITACTSIYSLIWLNVAETIHANALYPCSTVGEDIEFCHILRDKGLIPCKMNVFSHLKKARASTGFVDKFLRSVTVHEISHTTWHSSNDLSSANSMTKLFLDLCGYERWRDPSCSLQSTDCYVTVVNDVCMPDKYSNATSNDRVRYWNRQIINMDYHHHEELMDQCDNKIARPWFVIVSSEILKLGAEVAFADHKSFTRDNRFKSFWNSYVVYRYVEAIEDTVASPLSCKRPLTDSDNTLNSSPNKKRDLGAIPISLPADEPIVTSAVQSPEPKLTNNSSSSNELSILTSNLAESTIAINSSSSESVPMTPMTPSSSTKSKSKRESDVHDLVLKEYLRDKFGSDETCRTLDNLEWKHDLRDNRPDLFDKWDLSVFKNVVAPFRKHYGIKIDIKKRKSTSKEDDEDKDE